jgi:accessory colonization factor AcfC
MKGKGLGLLIAGLLSLLAVATATAAAPAMTLRVYGPGGPHLVLEECAELFQEKYGIKVAIIKAKPQELERRIRADGDLYYGGAECMLEEFVRRNPDVIDLSTVARLAPRRVGVIVRKGNPRQIQGVEDLNREGIEVLEVKLENMSRLYRSPAAPGHNIRRLVYTGRQGIDTWLAQGQVDAWITYKSWHVLLDEAAADFIDIPCDDTGLRFTPIALTQRTPHRQQARQFIDFLQSAEARQIFQKHGWE